MNAQIEMCRNLIFRSMLKGSYTKIWAAGWKDIGVETIAETRIVDFMK